MDKNKIWLDLIIELQSLAQAGLTYGKDIYALFGCWWGVCRKY